MTRTQYYTATSIDGFIADPDNGLEWLLALRQSEAGKREFPDFLAGVGAIAMGSTTYQWILDHDELLDEPGSWPYRQPCWVFSSRTLPTVPDADLRFVSGDVVPVHAAMTEAAGGANIWLVGGGELVGQFADVGLLDEIVLGVGSVFLGGGAPLLPRRLTPPRVRLTEVRQDGEDFVTLRYEVGPVTAG